MKLSREQSVDIIESVIEQERRVPAMRDVLGQEIKKGDIVLHCHRSGDVSALYTKLVIDTRVNKKYGNAVDGVKVIGFSGTTIEWDSAAQEAVDIPLKLTMNSRGGWTTTERVVVVTDKVEPYIKEFLLSHYETE